MSARRLRHGFTARRARAFILLPVVLALMLVAAVAFLLNRAGGMNMQMAAGGLEADSARYVAEAGLAQINNQTQGLNCSGYTGLSAAFGAGSFIATVSKPSGTPVTLASTATLADGATSTLTRSNVTMHQTTQYVATLMPDAAGLDTYIRSANSDTNYGADNVLKVTTGNSVALVQFDLSSIPAGSIIVSASLWLSHSTGGANTMSAFRVTKAWTEGTGAAGSGATWNTYNGYRSWATAGGDYDPAVLATITLPGNGQWATWDLTAQMAAWSAGTQPNYGIALMGTSAGSNDAFVSSDDAANPTLHPTLKVTFQPPCVSSVTLPASHDTWIDEAHATANYGSSISFTVQITSAGKSGRGLVQFDLTTAPAGMKITNAKLRLYTGSVFPKLNSILTVYPVNAAWTESGANWKTANGSSNSWLCGCFGGNFGPAAASANITSSFSSGWVEWDVTALALQWFASPSTNYGVGVEINTSSAVIFNSKDFTVNPPQLVLTY
ncbi:MAG TPA: DNRLRE domain-containing protein [Burkholderiales bacterium]